MHQAVCFFCIMIDEAIEVANDEQVVIVFMWVDDQLTAHEDVIGLYQVENISAETVNHSYGHLNQDESISEQVTQAML